MTAMMAYNCISRWSGALGVCAIIAVIRPAHADPRAVVELFTSQGCSSCPPADKIVGELAKDPNVIALSMPIDYWDYLGWKDTLADSRFSARQKAYSHVRGDRNLYTPQMIVNGSAQVIGSDRAAIDGAIKNTEQGRGRDVGAGDDDVVGQTDQRLGRGEQGGERRLTAKSGSARSRRRCRSRSGAAKIAASEVTYYNVVRNLAEGRRLERQLREAGPFRWKIFPREGVDAAVVYVQDGNRDKPGADARRGLYGAALIALLSVRGVA